MIVRWHIIDKPESDTGGSMGYFQEAGAMPVPGDRVVMYPGEPDAYVVEVLHRTMEQPEANNPRVKITARVQRGVPTRSADD